MHVEKLDQKNMLSLELLRFENTEGDNFYTLMLMRADRVRDLSVRARRKDFDLTKEGAVLFSGLGEPTPEIMDRARLILDGVAEMLVLGIDPEDETLH